MSQEAPEAPRGGNILFLAILFVVVLTVLGLFYQLLGGVLGLRPRPPVTLP